MVQVGLSGLLPHMLEVKLRELGAVYVKHGLWKPHAVSDGNLVTGQHPYSSGACAKLCIEAMQASDSRQ